MQNTDPAGEKRIKEMCDRIKMDFMMELKETYACERQLLLFLRRANSASSTRYLKACFKGHRTATQQHVARLERVFKMLDGKSRARACREAGTLISEAGVLLKATQKNTLARDMGLIGLAQKMERLEIKRYNRLISLANDLGNVSLVRLLEETLTEEREAEESFAAVREDSLNDEAFVTENEKQINLEEQAEALEAV